MPHHELATRCTCDEHTDEHPCPYAEDVDDDGEFTCTCCDACTDACAQDI